MNGQEDMAGRENMTGDFTSPGGFVFGVTGWTWGEQRPKSITFFLDGTAKVSDQHGRPIKGTVKDGKPVYFDKCGHAAVVAALADERVDWYSLVCAGWPQLRYDDLRAAYFPGKDGKPAKATMPPTPEDELKKIADQQLRRDALRIRREADAEREKEFAARDEE